MQETFYQRLLAALETIQIVLQYFVHGVPLFLVQAIVAFWKLLFQSFIHKAVNKITHNLLHTSGITSNNVFKLSGSLNRTKVKNQVEKKQFGAKWPKASVEQSTSAIPDNTCKSSELYLISHCWKTCATKIKNCRKKNQPIAS